MIEKFEGDYRFLSNFYPAQIEILVDGNSENFPTIEHFYQSMKNDDPEYKRLILSCKTAGQAKRASKDVVLRSDWNEFKYVVMRVGVRAKFTQHPELLKALIATDPHNLIEGNRWHDNVWGVCTCNDCARTRRGKSYPINMLGVFLMSIRDDYARLKPLVKP